MIGCAGDGDHSDDYEYEYEFSVFEISDLFYSFSEISVFEPLYIVNIKNIIKT
jgi:hypothetical protein